MTTEGLIQLIVVIVLSLWGTQVSCKLRKHHMDQQDEIAANQQKILRQQEEILRQQKENKTNDEP